jgi:hypothetical protein
VGGGDAHPWHPRRQAVASWTDFFERYDTAKYGSAGAPLHDPCVIAYLLEPSLFTGRHINVEIETGSDLTLGMTVADWWRVTGREPNAMFMGGCGPGRVLPAVDGAVGEVVRGELTEGPSLGHNKASKRQRFRRASCIVVARIESNAHSNY